MIGSESSKVAGDYTVAPSFHIGVQVEFKLCFKLTILKDQEYDGMDSETHPTI
jgi:hypothetical protein